VSDSALSIEDDSDELWWALVFQRMCPFINRNRS